MKILQGGVPKCGNFWLYKIIQQILIKSGRTNTSFIEQQPVYQLSKSWELNFPEQAGIDVLDITDLQCSYRISSIFRMPIENISEYVSQTSHVWTHSPVCKQSDEIFRLFDKKVYIIRDPRDRAISAAQYFCLGYMLKYFPQEHTNPDVFLNANFTALMEEWVWHVWDHLRLSEKHDIHIAFYENFNIGFNNELDRLLDYLNITLSNSQRVELGEAVSFKTLQKNNQNHLKKGRSGYWVNRLSASQVKTAERIAGPMLRYLGYPSNDKHYQCIEVKPSTCDFEELKSDLIASQKMSR